MGNNETAPKTRMVLQVEVTDIFFPLLIFSDCFSLVLHLARVSVTTHSMRRYLDPTEVAQTVQLLQDGSSICAIARRFALSPSTVSRAWRRFQETGSYSRRAGQGRRRSANSVRCSVSAAPQGYAVFIQIKVYKTYPCVAADTEQRTLFASSGYSPKWCYADEEETDCWIKSLFLFSLRRKSVLVASLNSDWTTDGRWTILTMSFILFWALTVLFTWQSMGQSQDSRVSSKIS